MLGNIIVIAIVALVFGLSLKKVITDMKKGGCSGCQGNCAGCGQQCHIADHKKS